MTKHVADELNMPTHNDNPHTVDLVIDDIVPMAEVLNIDSEVVSSLIGDIKARAEVGYTRYGTYLQPYNGRNSLLDAYQECIDQLKYIRTHMYENPSDDEMYNIYISLIKIAAQINVRLNNN